MAIIPRKKAITLLQMDGHFTGEEFSRAIDLAFQGCQKIYAVQRQALKDKYEVRREE
jgi:exosome complex component RRP41